MQCRIDMAMKALERLDPARLGIISKRIEHGARHMIVDPVDPTGIARTRIGFQVVNAHAASWPLPDAKMSIVDPDVASAPSASVSVRSSARNISRTDTLTVPSGMSLPL